MLKYLIKEQNKQNNKTLTRSVATTSASAKITATTTTEDTENVGPSPNEETKNAFSLMKLDLGEKNEGPRQPVMHPFPSRVIGGQKRSFCSSWYGNFKSWLEYSITQDAAFCFLCRHFAVASSLNDIKRLTVLGVQNWKNALQKFKNHDSCAPHQSAKLRFLDYQNSLQVGSVSELQVNANLDDILKRRAYLSKLLDVLILNAKQCIPQRGHDESKESNNRGNFLEILSLVSKYDKSDQIQMPKNASYQSPSSQNDLLETIASVIKNKIVKEVKESSFISVLADETRDISRKEQMSFCIRYFYRGQIYERFISFTEVRDLTASGLTKAIYSVLQQNNITGVEIVAQSYDGANVMSGKYNGVQEIFRQKYSKAIYIHCYAHRLNLVLVDVYSGITRVWEFFSLIGSIYSYFSRSGLAHQGLQDLLEEIKIGKVELVEKSDTRWACQIRSLKAIRKSYKALVQYLENPKDASDPVQAKGLLIFLKDPSTIVILLILIEIFGLTEGLNSLLQNPKVDLGNAIFAVEAVQQAAQKLRDDKVFESIIQKSQNLANEVGLSNNFLVKQSRRETQISSKLTDFVTNHSVGQRNTNQDPIADLKVNVFFATIDKLKTELHNRFTGGPNTNILKAIECMSPSWILKKQNEFLSIERLRPFCEHYQVELSEAEITVAKNYLSNTTHGNMEKKNMMDLLLILPKDMFPNLFKILQIAVTIPIGTASNERAFSVLRRLKTYLSNTMGQERLSSSAIISIEKPLAIKLCKNCVIDKFADIKNRRVELTHTLVPHPHESEDLTTL